MKQNDPLGTNMKLLPKQDNQRTIRKPYLLKDCAYDNLSGKHYMFRNIDVSDEA